MEYLRNASVPAALRGLPGAGIDRLDIGIENGRIASLTPPAPGPGRQMEGGLVLPAFVDIHTHLDKGHIWPRQANPDGTWLGALEAVHADRTRNWSAGDMARRMDFALRCAFAHGTAAIRTHLDFGPPNHRVSWETFAKMRDKWAGRVELQAVSLVGPDQLLDPAALDVMGRTTAEFGGRMGGSVAVHGESKKAMLMLVDKAGELGLDLDLHTDETGDPAAHALEHLAEAVIETGYTGKVLAGHCCVLTVQDESTQKRTIEKVARAGIAIVSLPMCNIYLQSRDPAGKATPLRRGVTLLKEFRAAGVPVAIASDNTRDPFYAYGDLDGLEVLREGARIVHFDHPQETAWQWARINGADAAAIAGFTYTAEIKVGAPADLIAVRARNWTELLSRPQSDRIVLRHGQPIDTTLPDYRELDDLMEP